MAKKYYLTEEQKLVAIERATEGMSLTKIQEEICISAYQFFKVKETDLIFEKKFQRARLEGLEVLADDLLDIADDTTIDPHRARLKSDNSKWILSKRKPEVYGERIDLNVNSTVDISGALAAAKQRVVGPLAVSGAISGAIDDTNDEDIIDITDVSADDDDSGVFD